VNEKDDTGSGSSVRWAVIHTSTRPAMAHFSSVSFGHLAVWPFFLRCHLEVGRLQLRHWTMVSGQWSTVAGGHTAV